MCWNTLVIKGAGCTCVVHAGGSKWLHAWLVHVLLHAQPVAAVFLPEAGRAALGPCGQSRSLLDGCSTP